jgi:hypothetical protein
MLRVLTFFHGQTVPRATMSESNINRYRENAMKWRREAEGAGDEEARRNCMMLAEGYKRLVEILSPVPGPPSQSQDKSTAGTM